jgi:hypothetical protein
VGAKMESVPPPGHIVLVVYTARCRDIDQDLISAATEGREGEQGPMVNV